MGRNWKSNKRNGNRFESEHPNINMESLAKDIQTWNDIGKKIWAQKQFKVDIQRVYESN